jgi:hypothetical protein
MNIKHTEAFDLAYRFVTETNLNIFLTGKAGTGKTTFLKYLRENSYKKMVVAAPTGVAAINAGGVTLHSLFQLPFAPYVPAKDPAGNGMNAHSLLSQIRYNREKLILFRTLELLVIDEASMVASHTVDAIDTLLRSVRRRHELPFGGVQLLFIGDLHQLPPVVKNQDWSFLKNYYPSVFFFDSLVLRENIPVMVELKEIFRQRDDSFIQVLNEIRHNDLTEKSLEMLNARMKKDFSPADDEGYITLTTHNQQADEINKMKLNGLGSKSFTYKAEVYGNFSENAFPADPSLDLKEGAQVMFLKNDVEGKKYFNGKIGTVTGLSASSIQVRCKGEDKTIDVKKHEWKNMNYSLNPDTREITEEELGSFFQYPLRLAWAITIHKSQGLTFEKLIIDSEKAFATGQVYVALSRCTSLEGLVLTSPVNRRFLGADTNLKTWQEKNNDEKNLHGRFTESRQQFMLQELLSVFAWEKWKYAMNELEEIIVENSDHLPAAAPKWLESIKEKQKEIDSTAGRFKLSISELRLHHPSVEENEPLQQRIKEASAYFSTGITEWRNSFLTHPISVDTRKNARRLDEALNELNHLTHEILHRVDHCRNGFILNEYLKTGKKLISGPAKVSSSYAQDTVHGISSEELEHAELYNRLAAMRSRIGKKNMKPLFTIFSNNAIKNVCTVLPGNKEALLKAKGFGKVKAGKYGEEVVAIVKTYCLERGIEADTRPKRAARDST